MDSAYPLRPAAARLHVDGMNIDTGIARISVQPNRPCLLSLSSGGQEVAELCIDVVDEKGVPGSVSTLSADLEESGPLRAVVRLDGNIKRAGRDWLDVIVRIHAYAGLSSVRCDVTLRNPRRARHPSGRWDLGDPGSAFIKAASLHWRRTAPSPMRLRCSPEINTPLQAMETPFELSQDSSGGEHWRSTTHISRRREVPFRFRGYQLRAGGAHRQGNRATPIVVLGEGPASLALAVEHFWQNFPKAIVSDGVGITLHLFPPECADIHEIQGGEQKTHSVHLLAGEDPVTSVPLEWVRSTRCGSARAPRTTATQEPCRT